MVCMCACVRVAVGYRIHEHVSVVPSQSRRDDAVLDGNAGGALHPHARLHHVLANVCALHAALRLDANADACMQMRGDRTLRASLSLSSTPRSPFTSIFSIVVAPLASTVPWR